MTIQDMVIEFLRTEKLIRSDERPGEEDPLISSGILDSFNIVALVDHLERTFSVRVDRKHLTQKNLDTLKSIEAIFKNAHPVQ